MCYHPVFIYNQLQTHQPMSVLSYMCDSLSEYVCIPVLCISIVCFLFQFLFSQNIFRTDFLFLLHPDRFGMATYLFQGQCRHVCPEGLFHSARRRCEPCPADCVICIAADRCLDCSPGHKLRYGQCVPLECRAGER